MRFASTSNHDRNMISLQIKLDQEKFDSNLMSILTHNRLTSDVLVNLIKYSTDSNTFQRLSLQKHQNLNQEWNIICEKAI